MPAYHDGWSFVIDAPPHWVGNFIQELCGFVTGEADDDLDRERIDELTGEFRAQFRDDNPIEDLIADDLEYDDNVPSIAPCTVYPTPGWSYVGHGNFREVADGESPAFPAYLSVRIFLTREPTTDEVEFLKRRANEFAQRGTEFSGPFEISGFRLVREQLSIEQKSV